MTRRRPGMHPHDGALIQLRFDAYRHLGERLDQVAGVPRGFQWSASVVRQTTRSATAHPYRPPTKVAGPPWASIWKTKAGCHVRPPFAVVHSPVRPRSIQARRSDPTNSVARCPDNGMSPTLAGVGPNPPVEATRSHWSPPSAERYKDLNCMIVAGWLAQTIQTRPPTNAATARSSVAWSQGASRLRQCRPPSIVVDRR